MKTKKYEILIHSEGSLTGSDIHRFEEGNEMEYWGIVMEDNQRIHVTDGYCDAFDARNAAQKWINENRAAQLKINADNKLLEVLGF